MLSPKRTKFRKAHKGRIHGAAKGGTALKCPQCRRVYPIKDDIPVMLIDEATIEP